MRRRHLWWLALVVAGCDEGPHCGSCVVVVEDSVTLDDAGFTMASRVVRTIDGGFAAIGTYEPERIYRFDSRGRILQSVGRKGTGPGEFNRLSNLVRGNGDSLIVIDGARLHFLDAHLNWSSTVATPMMPLEVLALPDGAIVGHPGMTSRSAMPLFYRLYPDSASEVRWFDYDTDDVPLSALRLISAYGGEIWSVGRVTLDIEVFDAVGQPLREFRVEHPWFRSREPDGSVRVEDIVHTSEGGLLLLVARERQDWERPRAAAHADAAPVPLTTDQFVDRWEQQILVVNSGGSVVYVSRTPPEVAVLGFADPDHLYGYTSGEDLRLTVWRARLEGSSTT